MAVIHISEAEATRDFAAVMAHIRSGAEVVIENGSSAVAIVRPSGDPNLRTLSESLRLARERGSTATLDGDFAADLEAAIESHGDPLKVSWD